MKKACSLVLVLVLSCTPLWSQTVDSTTTKTASFEAEPQLIFGLSHASASLDPELATSGLLGVDIGVALDYQFTEHIGISAGMLYRQGGYNLDATQENVESWILLKRFGIPVCAMVLPALDPNVIVRVGIEPGILLSAVNKYQGANGNTGERDLTSTYASFLMAGTISTHVRWWDFIEVGLAYQHDFLSVQNSATSTTYLQNFSLQLRFIPNEFDG